MPDATSNAAEAEANKEIATVLGQASPPEFVVAWINCGETILSTQWLSAEEMVGVKDWFDYFGYNRHSRTT